jgi:hypothetical protein
MIEKIPDEVIQYKIIKYLENKEIINLSLTNKTMNEKIDNETVWKEKCSTEFEKIEKEESKNWKETYINEYNNFFGPLLSLLSFELTFFFNKTQTNRILNPEEETLRIIKKTSRQLKKRFMQKQKNIFSMIKLFTKFKIMVFAIFAIFVLLFTEYFFPTFFEYPYIFNFRISPRFYIYTTIYSFLFTISTLKKKKNQFTDNYTSKNMLILETENDPSSLTLDIANMVFEVLLEEIFFRYVFICILMIVFMVTNKIIEFIVLFLVFLSVLIALKQLVNLHMKLFNFFIVIAFRISLIWYHSNYDLLFGVLSLFSVLVHFFTGNYYYNLLLGNDFSKILFTNSIIFLGIFWN